MKKFLNKLSSSGNLREDQYDDEEHLDIHYRKPSTLPADAKDTSEDLKLKKSRSISKATSPRKEAMEIDDFSKKKSTSGGIKKDKEKDKDKLNESDDKLVRKSFSLRTVSLFKSTDQVKENNNMRSPSLKNIFASQYNQHRDVHDALGESSSDEEEDAFVPRNNSNANDEDFHYSPSTTPIRVPSAPGRMAYSPQPSLAPRPMSPSSPSSTKIPHSPTMAPSPLSIPPSPSHSYSPPRSPFASSPTNARVPAFTQSPPVHALVITPQATSAKPTSPHVIVADTFDARFVDPNATRLRTDSITDDYGAGAFRQDADVDSDSDNGEDIDMTDADPVYQKKSGLFSFSNKPRKLKA